VITKPEEHDINRAGKRLLRDVLEPLGWVVNDTQEDYGIDYNVQVFDGKSPTGTWFHVQLKSSASSHYSADNSFISQVLSLDHARHYARDMREPVIVIHADVVSKRIYWCAPQLDSELVAAVRDATASSATVRMPTYQQLPQTAPRLLGSLDKIYLTLATRELTSASTVSFAELLKHIPDQQKSYRAFQEKGDAVRLLRIRDLFREGKFDEARPRAAALLADPNSTVEMKFWAQLQLQGMDYSETTYGGKPQSELPKVLLTHAKALQTLTASGPNYLKFYSLITRHAAELDILTHEDVGLFMALQQHLQGGGDPMMVLGLQARRLALSKRIISKYNRCVRLARYAANYADRWMLGRALTNIVNAIPPYLVTLHWEGELEAENAFTNSALQICKAAKWIGEETGDTEGIVMAVISALVTARSEDSAGYKWARDVAGSLSDPETREDAFRQIERAVKRWRGERVEGDYRGDTIWQITQNIATSLGIDLSNEADPLVQSLKIAAKDNSPERALATCEHLLVSLGATGPRAQWIRRYFNLGTAGSKVVHCTLHNYHSEGKELDTAHDRFKRERCDSCPDKKPRPDGWRYTDDARQDLEARHYEFVRRLAGTAQGFRYTDED
jgi:Domain of unknown function (DUF4365)